MEYLATERKTGAAMPSPFKFKQHGKSGIPVSELFPKVAESVDDLCIIRSMKADVPNHEPSLLLMNCGEARLDPSELRLVGHLRAWQRKSESARLRRSLPGRISDPGIAELAVRFPARRLPGHVHRHAAHGAQPAHRARQELEQHAAGATPAARPADGAEPPPPAGARRTSAADAALESRIQSYELAYRMQMDAADAFDISREPKNIRDMYGEGVQARQMLIARRLLERGVRFVQVWHGAGQPWDNHDDLEVNHRRSPRSAINRSARC
jgi:hypothetical protein